MNPPFSFRSMLLRLIGPVLTICVIGYFIFFTLHGERGVTALTAVRAELAAEQAELAAFQAERQRLEQDVFGLREPTLDADLLESRAREMLGYGYPGEQVILPEGAWVMPGRRPLPAE